MYLPTGTPHAARAQDTVSLHVTLGINQLTWRGLVQRTLAEVAETVPDEHLPAGYLEDPAQLAGELADRLGCLAEEIRGLDTTAAIEAEVRRFLTHRSPRLAAGLHAVLAADANPAHTRLPRSTRTNR